MPLSWNEIKTRALAFSKEWQDETSEDAEAKTFRDGFFNIHGVPRRRVATFEEPVKKLSEKYGYIDLYRKSVLIVEHKSRGKSLDSAYSQALDYFPGLSNRDLPKYVIVSDFARIRLCDLEEKEEHEFDLKDLHKNVRLFGFIAGYQTHKIQEQDPVNIKAAAQAVLDARAQFPESTLVDLYDPLTMPPVLLKAHQQLNKAVDAAYGKTNFTTEAQRVAFLFELYQKYTSLFALEKPKRRAKS
ncbi:MAG: hypothetical protein CVU52_08785 [Deltaproteobacteria bacterium HGW-Deltaproteobacteria-10]|jgi:hypothetical protein|nr:MAG: hypothetical protein CVU62_14980 [Deltaproteobacteria bacterium HGW-Deltaproteobacteria-2]PKN70893.1 MAG: hypothetical protein CVU52_08785 [Deltaproteobacteria bacterium HGW-Deltaproteobacteria-10]